MKASFCCEVTPPISYVAPAGRVIPSSAVCTAVLAAPVSSPAGVAVTVLVRPPSTRTRWTGPSTWVTVATLSSRTGPVAVVSFSALTSARLSGAVALVLTITSWAAPFRVTWAVVAPCTAVRSADTIVWSLRPYFAACSPLATMLICGALSLRSLLTSVTWVTLVSACWICSVAAVSVASSEARTDTSMSLLPNPPPPPSPTVISPPSVIFPSSPVRTSWTAAASSLVLIV